MHICMVTKRINTTLDENLWKIAKNRRISLAHALDIGLRHLIGNSHDLECEKIPNPERKLNKIRKTMQNKIDELNDEIEKLKTQY